MLKSKVTRISNCLITRGGASIEIMEQVVFKANLFVIFGDIRAYFSI